MAQAGEISQVIVLPEERAGRTRENHIPVLKWVLGVVLLAILSTLAGCGWVIHEVLANHPGLVDVTPGTFLLRSVRQVSTDVVAGPVLITAIAWCVLTFLGIRVVRTWGSGILSSSKAAQANLRQQLEQIETRLGLANSATEFWKGQARKADERTQSAEFSRQELEGRMGQLTVREKHLAREQEVLSRSKNRLEKHVEARTIELHRLQQRYSSILNSAGEGICSFDLEGRISFANPAAASMMGWSEEELQGMEGDEVFTDYGRKSVREDLAVLPDQDSHPAPVMFRRKDATRFPVEMVRTPVEENGRQVGTVLIFKDVTERTEADERFVAKVAELARSNTELEQFAFVASHDLQEPLRKIQAFGDRLKTRLGEDVSPDALDYLCRMQSASARMQGLIDGLLMYSRVLTRAQPYTRVNLNTIVREVIEDLEVRIEKTGAEMQVEELPSIDADALQIRQLLQNLIGNALKFQAHDNKPVVNISARVISQESIRSNGSGHTEFATKSDCCELTVQDNGIGFDESYLKRLFVVFQRLHSRSEFEGAGIGLAVCRKIANRHGGTITAKSKPGEGARFIVLLPMRQGADEGGVA